MNIIVLNYIVWQRASVILTREDVVSTPNCTCYLVVAVAVSVCAVVTILPVVCVNTAERVTTGTARDPSNTAGHVDVSICFHYL